jgi:hypothetical protein
VQPWLDLERKLRKITAIDEALNISLFPLIKGAVQRII